MVAGVGMLERSATWRLVTPWAKVALLPDKAPCRAISAGLVPGVLLPRGAAPDRFRFTRKLSSSAQKA